MGHPARPIAPAAPQLRLVTGPGEPGRSPGPAAIRALRPHQWAKNGLLFVPLLTAHRLLDVGALATVLAAVAAFSACASAVYLFNDWLDVESDRQHPTKRRRPLASGELSLSTALAMMAGLLALGGGLAALVLPWQFSAMLAGYLGLTTWYTLRLKQELLVDVLVLAGLYTWRVLAGGVAVGIEVSEWLLAFSMFLFLSLALVKRYAELLAVEQREETQIPRRGYHVHDLSIIQGLGPACGALAVLVYCLYITSPAARALYPAPKFLWLAGPLLLYWVTRFWLLARRGKLTDDPVIFALRDRASYVVGLLAGVLLAASTWF